MTSKNKLVAAAVGFVAVAAIAAGGAWYLLRNDSPDAVSLQGALESIGTSASSDPEAADLAGTWNLVAGTNSFVGYRVQETLGGIGATTAVGRTQTLQGTLNFDGKSITSVDITADVSTLTSDKNMRDNAIKTQALESNTYPSAKFALTSPIQIADLPSDGEKVTKTVKGELTLHGVTKAVELDVEGVLQGSQVVLVGSTDVVFADYGMSQPRSAAVISIEDRGTMEFQLLFSKAA